MGASSARIGWLDGLRAYAVAGVVLVHSAQVAGAGGTAGKLAGLGEYGVQLFFVISGITIFSTLSRHLAEGMPVRAWYVKRVMRIAPLYYTAIAVYLLDSLAKAHFGGHPPAVALDPLNVAANLLFVHAIIPSAANSIVPGGWSIGVEMAFYLIAPAVLLLGAGTGRPVVVALALAGASLVLALTLGWDAANNSYRYFWPPAQFPVLLIGFAFAAAGRPGGPVIGGLALTLGAAAGAACGTVLGLLPELAPTCWGAAFIGLAILAGGPLNLAFDNPVARWLGGISYSVYIVHFALLDLLRIAAKRGVIQLDGGPVALVLVFSAALAGAVALAAVSKRFIEDPGIALGSRLARRFVTSARGPALASAR